MDALEQEYKGKVDIYTFDLTQPANQCQLTKIGITHVPAIVYYDSKGKQVDTTDQLLTQKQLESMLNDLLAGRTPTTPTTSTTGS